MQGPDGMEIISVTRSNYDKIVKLSQGSDEPYNYDDLDLMREIALARNSCAWVMFMKPKMMNIQSIRPLPETPSPGTAYSYPRYSAIGKPQNDLWRDGLGELRVDHLGNSWRWSLADEETNTFYWDYMGVIPKD